MKHIIYLDVLISINLFISYFILLGTGKFLSLKLKRFRIILGAMLGGSYSLIIFLPTISALFSVPLKLFLSILMVLLAFGYSQKRLLIKAIAVFHLISLVFLAVSFLLWYLISPPGLWLKNGVIYLNISPMFLTISTVISYCAFQLINRLAGKQVPPKTFCNIWVKLAEKELKIRAKIDTGNTLKEPFSYLPVIVVEYQYIKDILPKQIRNFILNKKYDARPGGNFNFRIVPFKSISGEGVLPAFKPDKLFMERRRAIAKEAYVAICEQGMLPGEYEALINPDLVD